MLFGRRCITVLSLLCSVFRHAVLKCDLLYCLVGWRWKCHQLWLLSSLAHPLQPMQLHLLVQTTLQSLQVSRSSIPTIYVSYVVML